MNENEICDILTRIQEIEKLQKELQNLLPNATNKNRINIEKPVEVTNLKRESSSTIRFPSLLTFPGINEQSNVRKNNRIKSSKEIRSSMMNMNNIQTKESLKNVNASRRASLNITINDSSAKCHRTNNNKDLPKILENSVKTRAKNLQSFNSKSTLNNKKTSNASTISEKIVNNIPKIRDSKKSGKQKINHSKSVNVNRNIKDKNEEYISSEYKKKSNLSSDSSCPQTSDVQVQMEKSEKNPGMLVCWGNQNEREKSNDILIKKRRSKFDILEKILKRLGYCILDNQSISSSIGCYSNDKPRYFVLRKVEKSPFIANEKQETDEILSSIKEVIICTNIAANNVRLDSNLNSNMAAICKIIKKFDGIDKVSKIFKMSWKKTDFSDTLRHGNRLIEIQDNMNDPPCLILNRNSKPFETINTKSLRGKKYSFKFLRKICFCMNL
ncbi:uncharacterized protein LOC122525640 [Polistes fuscatus]|uniref:uncharacterized protein LOC122525640 n=1 Tax=Polistes fuscatus TaxID=30207 RepID=UPI001CAA1216|nr:uncharacterized protein LOC122525640 [Polistes fuscatus]